MARGDQLPGMPGQSKEGNSARGRYSQRLGRLRQHLPGLRADAILVSHLPNVRYLCGFSGSAGLLLVREHAATLFTDSRYTFQAREEVGGAHVHIAKKGLLRGAADRLRGMRGRHRIAFSPGSMTVAQQEAVRAAVGDRARWVGDGNAVEGLRAIKDAEELAWMREAAELISEVCRRTLRLLRAGMTELDVAAEIEYRIKKLGGSGPSFDTIVASGPRSAWAHARPTPTPIGKYELVVLDLGAILRGYCSDLTRTVFLGRAPGKIRRMYAAVLEAQAAAREEIRPGRRAWEVDRAARRALEKRGLGRFFTHSTGHGLGLEVHEMPRLGRGDETILQEGMVLTIEPGVYLEGLGGIRMEDDVVVTAQGAVNLTTAPRDQFEL